MTDFPKKTAALDADLWAWLTDSYPPLNSSEGLQAALGQGFRPMKALKWQAVLLRPRDSRAWEEEGKLWEKHGPTVMAEWVARYPGTRPSAWWRHIAPSPRRREGGAGEPDGRDLRLRMGVPHTWLFEGLDAAAPPTFEGQAAFLARHSLFLPGEEEAVPWPLLDPEELVVELGEYRWTVQPRSSQELHQLAQEAAEI